MSIERNKFLDFGRLASEYLQEYQTEYGTLASLLILLPTTKDPVDARVVCTIDSSLEYEEALDGLLSCVEAAILTMRAYDVETGTIYDLVHRAIENAEDIRAIKTFREHDDIVN